MNKTILTGRLVRDPEVKYVKEKAVATFTLAVDRPYIKDKERETDFVPIVVWGKVAEFCGNYLSKGSKIFIDGRLQIRSYEKDGQRRYVTEVIAHSVEALEKIKRAEADAETQSVIDSFSDETGEVPF